MVLGTLLQYLSLLINMTVLLTVSSKKKRLGCRKKLVVLKWKDSSLDERMLGFKSQRLYIGSNHYCCAWHRFHWLLWIRNSSTAFVSFDICSLHHFSAYPTKWSNRLKQFVGNLLTNCLSVFDYFVGLTLKGLGMASTMFIDNKAVLFLLIMPMIHFRGCM